MTLLVFNAGSSSLKFRLYADDAGATPALKASGTVTHLGEHAQWKWRDANTSGDEIISARTHWEAASHVLRWLRKLSLTKEISAVGHRIVHGGQLFREPVLLTTDVIAKLETLNALAPLHNPLALQVIHTCHLALPALPMVAVFDTAFHATLPERARQYALPTEWVERYGIRRYGFHGIAHRYMYERYLQLSGGSPDARVISFQLGNGCSAAAIRAGHSIDTSMGYTPLEGLVMSTRCGDVDPGAIAQLAAHLPPRALSEALQRASGLAALSGVGADMRELLLQANAGHAGARRAIEVFCHRARKYLGAYLVGLGGADAIVFGGGIGENAPTIRAQICADMQWCGLALDDAANAAAIGAEQLISRGSAGIAVYVIPVDEEVLIARDTRALLAG